MDADFVNGFVSHRRLWYRTASGDLLARFLRSLRDREIYGNRCPACSATMVPPRSCCLYCWAPCEGWHRISDRGTVGFVTVVNIERYGSDIEIPYVLANVRLDGASTDFVHLVAMDDPWQCRMGMRIEAVWRDERKGSLEDDIDHFRPTREPDVPIEELHGRGLLEAWPDREKYPRWPNAL